MLRGNAVGRPNISRRTMIKAIGGTLVAAPLTAAVSGCGSAASDPNTLRVSYQQFGSGRVLEDYLKPVIRAYTAAHPEITVELVPLVAAENDYFTKNELMMSSARTACDIVYEDTFILKSDIAAGYLRPIDSYLASWPMWDVFYDVAKKAVRGEDGKTYAVPAPTDTRALWYNRDLFEQAGLATPWEPRTWDDLLTAFRTLKDALPDVVPFNIYAGKPQGEKASMQGFEMLLYGTDSTLYDEEARKWVIGSPGFVESLAFIETVFAERLAPSIGNALDPNLTETITNSWLPGGQLAVNLDGNWISNNWVEGAPAEWPEWGDVMAVTKMPTQHGQAPGYTTLAGGWSWGLPIKAGKPDLAWDFLKEMVATEPTTAWTISDNKLTNRTDVAAREDYRTYGPTVEFFTSLVPDAIYRPALAPYPKVSSAIQAATEAVMTGQGSPEGAADAYDREVVEIVGAGDTARREA
jgi:multiple sugar transport system substrate-binding protein